MPKAGGLHSPTSFSNECRINYMCGSSQPTNITRNHKFPFYFCPPDIDGNLSIRSSRSWVFYTPIKITVISLWFWTGIFLAVSSPTFLLPPASPCKSQPQIPFTTSVYASVKPTACKEQMQLHKGSWDIWAVPRGSAISKMPGFPFQEPASSARSLHVGRFWGGRLPAPAENKGQAHLAEELQRRS